MSQGSSIAALRAALTTALQARPALAACTVNGHAPVNADDVGEFNDAIWLGQGDGDCEVAFLAGNAPLVFNEDYIATVRCQSLPIPDEQTGDLTESQATADSRASTLMGEVIATVASDPTLGLGPPDGPFTVFQIVGYSWRFTAGYVSENAAGAAFDLDLRVQARITNEESP